MGYSVFGSDAQIPSRALLVISVDTDRTRSFDVGSIGFVLRDG